jgi:hypothetical protein
VTNTDLLSAIALFLVAFFGVMFLLRMKKVSGKQHEVNRKFTDSILSEYSDRLKNYGSILAEIRGKVDLLESKLGNTTGNYIEKTGKNITVSDSLSKAEMQDNVISNVTASDASRDMNNNQSHSHDESDTTIDIILKSLIDAPQSARDIQHLINKSREHTSRLLKRLYVQNLLSRDSTSTPFKYTITDEGRRRLK